MDKYSQAVLLEQDMESAVADYAVKLHSILSDTINQNGEESVQDLFPFCIEILENLNFYIVENEKLTTNNTELSRKCDELSNTVKKLKLLRQKDLEKSLEIEDDLEQELFDCQERISDLEKKLKKSLDEVCKKRESVVYLNDTINNFSKQVESLLKDKITLQNEVAILKSHYYFPLQYSTIPISFTIPSLALNVLEGLPIHKNDVGLDENTFHSYAHRNMKQKIHMREVNISLYSDNQGKDLSTLLKNHFPKTTYVKPSLVKSGAPLKEIVHAVAQDANSFKENDYVVIIGGSNDIGFHEDTQIIKAYNDLFRYNFGCRARFIVSTIPIRYDLGPYSHENNSIRKINHKMKEHLLKQPRVKILDLGSKQRRFFSRDGKHLNIAGKTSIVKDIYKIISKS